MFAYARGEAELGAFRMISWALRLLVRSVTRLGLLVVTLSEEHKFLRQRHHKNNTSSSDNVTTSKPNLVTSK